MRCRLAQIVVFAAACLLVGRPHVYAQSSDSTASCSDSAASDDQEPSGPEISIAEVTFSGSLQMPISEQERIADSVKRKTYGTSLEAVTDEGIERVRAGWEDRGYFKVQVTAEMKTLTSSPVSQRIAMSVHVDEGSRYNLKGIRFRNNKAISSVDILRGLIPIADGDIFSREKIGAGLENLRKAYGELGYINFTSVPDTKFDDENRLISLVIDVDEGKQFRVGNVNVLGLEESAREQILKTLPIKHGQIYSSRLWEESLLKYASMFPDCDCPNRERLRLDNKSGVVTLTFDFRPCSTN
jgi:outer membrane protein insertion porin family